jgi:cellulose synthase/poly-beta-1,6-N-acetylglucosamine synthase-like glycosyltransferase/peptidoglycan/xylan/chitin deacetylase (PgdA/CDA1 family)/spore germination protein YaaH
MSPSAKPPVFYDPAGRRWRRVRRTWLALAVLVTTLAAIFIISVLANPVLPRFNLKQIEGLPRASDLKPEPPPAPLPPREQKAKRAKEELEQALSKTHVTPGKRRAQLPVVPPPAAPPVVQLPAPGVPTTKPLSIGFYVNWDDSSYASLKRNLNQLDWVMPEWARLQESSDSASPLTVDVDKAALDLIRQNRPQTPIIPLVQNYKDEQWNADLLARSLADEPSRQRLINALVSMVDENKFGGVGIDFEEVPTSTQANLLLFMQELHAAFQPHGWTVAQTVPFDNPDWNYEEYADATDYLMLMAYDQHWLTGEAGSISAQNWFEHTLSKRVNELEPAKTIICIGSYGYDWTQGEHDAKEVTFQEAVLSARDSEAKITFDPATRNPYFRYEEEDGTEHSVWFLDGVTAYNQIRAAGPYNFAGYALWRLGSEDPSIWSVFGSQHDAASPDGLHQIVYGYDVDYESNGEILQVTDQPKDGAREIKTDPSNGLITSEDYTATPTSYVITRTGDHPGLIALTFDDGPDPTWTPRILDVLKQEHVPATFFIIGEYGQANPDLLRRIVAEGHDIGNHTYTHPNLGETSDRIVDLELNATQRLIESVTGRSTTLFRPPYFGDAEANTPDEVRVMERARDLNYLTIGVRIDPDDWKLRNDDGTLRTADDFVKKTIAGALNTNPDTRGEVVLLHDGGGDRAQTLIALPRIIHELRARGYEFVAVSQLAGLTRDQAMPIVPQDQRFYANANAISFYLLLFGGRVLHWLFFTGIMLGLGRLVIIGALAFAQWWRARRRERLHSGETYKPSVSIIVPAYKEERVIVGTIESLLASDYEDFEIIIVDDGSPDKTSEIVRERFSDEPRVRLFTKENEGKAEALNYGLRHATGEIIIALDADTLFSPETVGALAHRFYDPKIGAIAGNAKVGNRINIVTRWQALEYITSQNLDRRAFASLNCITVVPGAVGAWRRELLDEVGGFASDTLAEDQDLTIKARRLGYKIGYEETAIAWTEAPDTLRTLARQRFRWAYGTLQCMWKHRGALFRPRYGTLGFISMPNVWIFQIFFQLVSPVMDLMLGWTLTWAILERIEHPTEFAANNLRQVLFYYALFLAVDWLSAAFAFLMERREQWRLLWWLLLQRFCYRQVMYYVMLKSIAHATRGVIVGWGKLERKATVEAKG